MCKTLMTGVPSRILAFDMQSAVDQSTVLPVGLIMIKAGAA